MSVPTSSMLRPTSRHLGQLAERRVRPCASRRVESSNATGILRNADAIAKAPDIAHCRGLIVVRRRLRAESIRTGQRIVMCSNFLPSLSALRRVHEHWYGVLLTTDTFRARIALINRRRKLRCQNESRRFCILPPRLSLSCCATKTPATDKSPLQGRGRRRVEGAWARSAQCAGFSERRYIQAVASCGALPLPIIDSRSAKCAYAGTSFHGRPARAPRLRMHVSNTAPERLAS
ncbi:hypothetical protein VTO73DRAFT_11498 [Trametes versicolor]